MRRHDREITDHTLITHIMSSCFCCRLALNDTLAPYVVPLNFGFERIDEQYVLYFHSALQGRKIYLIAQGCNAGFEMDTNHQLQTSDRPCGYSSKFQSIIGTGEVVMVTNTQEKTHALSQIVSHYTNENTWSFSPNALDNVTVFKLMVRQLSCKEHL